MPNSTHVLLWTDGPTPYANAIAAAGLSGRVTVDTLSRKDQPSDAQLTQTEALLAWGAPPGLLPRMSHLRWAQALTAGVEGWLALPDLPSDLTLTCARGTHRESMPENILGSLFYLTKPYAAAVADQKQSKWTRRVATPLTGQTLGILGLGAVGQDVARLATALGMKVIGTIRNPTPLPGLAEVLPPEQTNEVLAQSDFVVLLLPATPQTENFINAERLSHMKPTAWLLNFGRGQLIDDTALIAAARKLILPHSKLEGEANILIMPNLDTANVAYQMIKALADALPVGPILIGPSRPAHILTPSVTARGILNMTAIAAVEAQERAGRQQPTLFA